MPDGRREGPYTSDAVRRYVAGGRIPPTAYVVQEATGIQMALSRAGFVPEHMAAAAGAPPAAAQPARRDRHAWVVGGIVVAGIVLLLGGLMAVVAPVVVRGRSKARQSACLSNVKQIALACCMYASDHKGAFPSATDPQGFQNQIWPYMQNRSIFVCPEAPNEVGYAFNPKLAAKDSNKIVQPANTPMLWDAGARVGGMQPLPGTTPSRHNGGDNVGFADGHCKWCPASGIRGLVVDPWASGAEAED
jgi:prepilin-type processing-associated H-X9-DG protein